MSWLSRAGGACAFTLDRLDIPEALVLQSNFTLVWLPAGEAGAWGKAPKSGKLRGAVVPLMGLGKAQGSGAPDLS